jgi:uncharacterized OB-fold protein
MNWRLKEQRYKLIGTKCAGCSIVHFPARSMCPDCHKATEKHQLSGLGEIVSFTHIHTNPAGFAAPYTIALIKLNEGPMISSQVVSRKEDVDIGKKVRVVFRKLSEDGEAGLIHYGFKFEVIC